MVDHKAIADAMIDGNEAEARELTSKFNNRLEVIKQIGAIKLGREIALLELSEETQKANEHEKNSHLS